MLRTYVCEIRRVLNDDPRTPRYIETVPSRGYRFLAHVSSIHSIPVGDGQISEGPAANQDLAPDPQAVLNGVALTGSAPVCVGILHSLTGVMAWSEGPVVDATLLAIEEINARGGIRGRQIQPLVVDGQSQEETFIREAERLITEERVCTLFGCWTSSCRKALLPILSQHDHLLIYPTRNEGMEQCPNVVYTGATPN